MFEQHTLAIIYISLMGLAILLYAILDGYDLGVGILLPLDNTEQSDQMIASIGPFWDANETWLVLAVGLLLIAFPSAHSMILKALYLPTAIMLLGLILRGVAFDFRAKAAFGHQATWNKAFKGGSLLTTLSQGYMLGMYVMGFEQSVYAIAFSLCSALGILAAYSYIGACWLVMKTSDTLQLNAIRWASIAGRFCFAGVVAVSLLNPLVNPSVFAKWFNWPLGLFMLPLPLVCFALFIIVDRVLTRMPTKDDYLCWFPFTAVVVIYLFCFIGIGFSFFPYIVPGKLTIWQAVSAAESLNFLLWGAMFVIPCILAYTIFSYRVFWGKVSQLRYY